ncbi:HNH endonuclease [Terribacillus saccharophilus]|uniref:HNH endonuclease n=1 Tax=Terribacillus saccharophilus TaxID=361277 RepID=UPI0039821C9E
MKTATIEESTVLRFCKTCGKPKPIDQFEKDARVKAEDSRTHRCYDCKKKYIHKGAKAYYRLHDRYPKYQIAVEVAKEDIAVMYDSYTKCMYCGQSKKEDTRTFHLEHIIPLARSGRNHLSNNVFVCPTCNAMKGSKSFVDFFGSSGRVPLSNLRVVIWHIAHFGGMTTEEAENLLLKDDENWKNQQSEARII